MSTISDAVNAVRDVMHRKCADMGPKEYMQVLEEIYADVEGSIEALKEENEGMFD